MNPDWAYQDLVRHTSDYGLRVTTRNATVKRVVAQQVMFTSTPLVCVRKTAWKNCLREWEWFMSGSNRIEDLHPAVRPWWEPWTDSFGRVNFNYSVQFRKEQGSFTGAEGHTDFDQIDYLVRGIWEHPNSRRNVITTWNTSETASESCLITNCHGTVIQTFVGTSQDPKGLVLYTYQRSADLICGVPHNWLQYWAFLLWLAHRTGTNPAVLIWTGGDVHLYDRHAPIADQVLGVNYTRDVPQLVYKPTSEDFKADDFTLDREYRPQVLTRAEMIV